MSPVLDRLVALSGLSPIFAGTVIRRAIVRAGFDPDSLSARDISLVLPEVERALAVYMGPAQAREQAARLRSLG